MTRNEFYEEITNWHDLKLFCEMNNLDACDDVYDGETLDEYINNEVARFDDHWTYLRSYLDDIPNIYNDEYYRCDDPFEIISLDDTDFINYRDDTADEYDGDVGFDLDMEEEEEPEEIEDAIEEIAEEEEEEPEFNPLVFMANCAKRL